MIKKVFTIWQKEEYKYPAGNFLPSIHARLHDDEKIRKAMVIAPGGAYALLTPIEVEGISRQFYELGFNTFVLVYTNNVTQKHPVEYQALKDISRAIKYIRKNAKKLNIFPDKIVASGYSAGAHLVGNIAANYSCEELNLKDEYYQISNRPDAVMINYGPNSFPESLKTKKRTEDYLKRFTISDNLTKESPPLLIIHGMKDPLVSPIEALNIARACKEKDVSCEIHILENCGHGLSSKNKYEAEAKESLYVLEQLYETMKNISAEELEEYKPMWGELNKEMEYDEFIKVAMTKSIMGIYMKAMNIKPEEAASVIGRKELKNNPNEKLLLDIQLNWIKMIFFAD